MSTHYYLEFEKPVVELEQKVQELLQFSSGNADLKSEVAKLEKKIEKMR